MKTYLLLALAGQMVATIGGKPPLEFTPSPLADDQAACFVSAEDGQALVDAEPTKFAWAEPLPPAELQALAAAKTLALVEALAAKAKVELDQPKVKLGKLAPPEPEMSHARDSEEG